MKKYSYNLFPKQFVILGYLLVLLAAAGISVSIITMNGDKPQNLFPVSFVLLFAGIVMISLKSTLIINEEAGYVLKRSQLLSMILSTGKVKIPQNCERIVIKQEKKRGTGYYKFVIPVTYSFKSYDMFFQSGTNIVRLLNTDYKRAVRVAEFFKASLNLEYTYIFEEQKSN